MNGIFTTDQGVLLRVTRPTAPPAQAIWLAELLTRHGLRVPTYVRDEPYLTEDHAVFAIAMIDERGAVDWTEVGEMVARLHRVDLGQAAAGYPVPFCGDFPWWNFAGLLAEVGADLDAESRAAMEHAVQRDLPLLSERRNASHHRSVLCHGDVHPGNVLQSAAGPVLLDWDLVCSGPAAWDHAPLMTWSERWGAEVGIYEAFAEGYGRSFRGDPLAEAIAELRLVAATLMRVRAGRSDPTAADEAGLRLRYWRGEPDAPQWHAQ